MATDRRERNEIVGFIGLGYMGHGMAKNVVEAGFALRFIAHRRREAADDLRGRGGIQAVSVAELAASCDVVCLCLPGSPEVEAVVSGPEGLLSSAREGLVIVDASTSNPVSTKQIAAECAAAGVAFVDAPLGRTPKEAWDGTLDCMVGADEATLDRVRPVIEAWAARIVHTGPSAPATR